MSDIVTITIDGKKINTQRGDNLLKVALEHGIDIPKLCYNEKLTPTGACSLCIVKIENRRGVVRSCTIDVEDGMVITAFDDHLEEIRRTTLDMILSNHNDDCISCSTDGNCELQDLTFRYNLGRDQRMYTPIWGNFANKSDLTSPVLDYDSTRCIQCSQCIKACYELQGKGVLGYAERGIGTYVFAGMGKWEDSQCDGCGECIQQCPTGAITSKAIYTQHKMIREKDIERKVTTTCPYCGVGCQLEISLKKDKIVKVDGAQGIPNYGKLCVKGRFGLDFIQKKERLKKPLIKKNGQFKEVEWEEALDYTAKRLLEIKKKYGPDTIGGLSSARCTNEENFVFQKFMRAVVGTNNVDHCARLCHASTVVGLAGAFGSGAMTNSIDELEGADVILVTGSNTTETHPVIATHIKRAVLFKGAKLIVVDPRRIDLVRYAHLWLRQNNGTDVAWINGLMNVIVSENLQDQGFIKERTEGFEELETLVKDYTPEKVESITGIPADQLKAAAKLFGSVDKASIVYSMGITQHTTGTNNVRSLANLAMVTGNIGKESTGVNPLRGQNNVQGACDLGALPNVYPGYQKVTDAAAKEKFEKAWNAKLSDKVGYTVVELMNAAYDKKVKALYIMGENPMVSDPNIQHVKKALESVEFFVCQDIFPTETTQYADVVFPAASFAEKEGNYTNTERRILPLNIVIDPVGESKPDWAIVQEVSCRMGYDMQYNNVGDIIDEINALTPQYGGITKERIQKGELLQWPCPTADHPGTKYLHKGKFAKGKGTFIPAPYSPSKELPDENFPFVLSTGRILYHYHTGTMSRRSKALNQYVEGPYVEMSREDCEALGVKDKDQVKVSSRRGEITTTVMETKRVRKGSVFIPFHFAEAAANMLTNDEFDPTAKIPELKVCACKVEKI